MGRVLVLLHAFPLSRTCTRLSSKSVPAGWRLIAPDLPGLGLSEDGDETPTLDDYAKAMLQLTIDWRSRPPRSEACRSAVTSPWQWRVWNPGASLASFWPTPKRRPTTSKASRAATR